MDKVSFQSTNELTLIGDWLPAKNESSATVIQCHGFTGDRLEHGRFIESAGKFSESGLNVLSFDFSGSGDSDDAPLTVDQWEADLSAAIKFVRQNYETSCKHLGLFGLSLGGLTVLKLHAGVEAIVAAAPVTNKTLDYAERYTIEQAVELSGGGYIEVSPNGLTGRNAVVVTQQMIDDRNQVDQVGLISEITVPTLIIHGDKDDIVPIEDSRAASQLSDKVDLIEVAGAGHDIDPLDSFVNPAIGWFKQHLLA